MKQHGDLLKTTQKCLSLINVDLDRLVATRTPGYHTMPPGLALDVQWRNGTLSMERVEPVIAEEGPSYFIFKFEASMQLALNPEQAKQASVGVQVAEILANFSCTYQVIGDVALDDQGVNLFAQLNVPYHAWPYWRELCQSTSQRMQLPATPVPTLRIDVDGEKPSINFAVSQPVPPPQ